MWWGSIETTPTVSIPTPVLPSPNAYDYYVAAANALVDVKETANAIETGEKASSGRKAIWETVDQVNAVEARTAASRMEDIMSRSVTWVETLEEEKWATQAGLVEILFRRNWRVEMLKAFSEDSGMLNIIRGDAGRAYGMFTAGKSGILSDHADYMDGLIKNAKLPYAAKPPSPIMPQDPINQIILPVLDRSWFHVVTNEANNALLTVTVALRAYYVEHGKYPDKLDELTPEYLKKIPDDPFALKGPLKYKRVGDMYVLYSVGPDAKDDGGKAIDDPGKLSDERYKVEEDSTGDIVAGLNIY